MGYKFIQDTGEPGTWLARAYQQCSPAIVRFLKGFNDGTAAKFFDIPALKAAGLWYDTGILRITDKWGAWRDAETQLAYFKKGRKLIGSYGKAEAAVKMVAPDGKTYTKTVQRWYFDRTLDETAGNHVTNAFVGQSYHQYGLAVDLHLRALEYDFRNVQKNGAKTTVYKGVTYTNFHDLIKVIGLVDYAAFCGLEWGGSWKGFDDVEHFQDSSYKIPSAFDYVQKSWMNTAAIAAAAEKVSGVFGRGTGEAPYNSNYYWFDECFCYDFVRRYNQGGNPYDLDARTEKEKLRKSSPRPALWLYLLAAIAGGALVLKVRK